MLGLFVFLMVFNFVLAECDDDQLIVRLYDSDNSHASMWNENTDSYLEEICYDEIYGDEFIGDDPHACVGSNGVMFLYDVANSHVSEEEDEYYTEEVCYGDLACSYDTSSGSDCENEGEVVARLSGDYNAHVGTADASSYSVKVCCVAAEAYWADMEGNMITEAEYGDTVKLVYRGGVVDDMVIWEEDLLTADDEIRTVTPELDSDSGFVIGTWTISDSDLGETVDYDDFYFEVNGEKSTHMSILENGEDEEMDIAIMSPECGEYFDEGTSITISVSARDGDDEINGEITVDGEVVQTFANGGIEFDYNFDSAGESQVVVEAENSRGRQFKTISNIMILGMDNMASYVDGEYVAACISEPEDYTHIEGSEVFFNASMTRAIVVSDGVIELLIPGEHAFSWYWNFQPEDADFVLEDSTDSLGYEFTAGFPIAGENSASLTVTV